MTGARFLDLASADQREAYVVASQSLNKSATVLEKDMWVCWTLDALFSCPNLPTMAFKGGTSLSKVFDAIARFSEDIDVTIDHAGLMPEIDPYDPGISGKQRKRDDESLSRAMVALVRDIVAPHLQRHLADLGLDGALDSGTDGELVVNYPHLVDGRHSYFREGVKIEFGGKNMVEPSARHTLTPYVAAEFGQFVFPTAEVDVLAPERTFWEKVTLAHAESNRTEFRSPERISRHWHDLAVLSQHEIGTSALADLPLLQDVIVAKKRFFNSGTARYDDCLEGAARLLPDDEGLAGLGEDYRAMVDAEMLDDPLPFGELVDRIRALQDSVNRVVVTASR